jgi:carbon storage regulator
MSEYGHLVLTRRPGEVIHIGSEIQVTVLAVRGTQVRIQVSAPKSLAVHRDEVRERILREQSLSEAEVTRL